MPSVPNEESPFSFLSPFGKQDINLDTASPNRSPSWQEATRFSKKNLGGPRCVPRPPHVHTSTATIAVATTRDQIAACPCAATLQTNTVHVGFVVYRPSFRFPWTALSGVQPFSFLPMHTRSRVIQFKVDRLQNKCHFFSICHAPHACVGKQTRPCPNIMHKTI